MEKKIGKNVSSGAKKVENAEKETRRESAESVDSGTETKKKAVKKSTPKKTQKRSSGEKKERAHAQKRVEQAKKRAAKKEQKELRKAQIKEKKLEHKKLVAQKKLERKQKKMEKRAALKEKKLERKAERIARRELLKHESRAEKQKRMEREKKERVALKRQKAERRDKAREQKREAREAAHQRKAEAQKQKRQNRKGRKDRSRGVGGWLAAVISLGVACLALATIVTAGAFRMNDVTLSAENGARSTLYEMLSVSEDLDNNLTKLRISNGTEEQRRLLTDILVDSAVLESALERIPVDAQTSTDISSFVNKTNSYARKLLKKLATGATLNVAEKNTISYLWEINQDLTRELNTLTTTMTENDLKAFMKGTDGTMSEGFSHMGQTSKRESETEIDTPFAQGENVGKNMLERYEEISQSRAEELLRGYLETYQISSVEYTGETNTQGTSLYNFSLTDENGVEYFAQVSKNGGKLVFFDMYEENTNKQFNLEACNEIAQRFFENIGITGAEAVWYSDGGSVADIMYTGCEDGVFIYPEAVRVRVCECKGRVVGIDARGYFFNHKTRNLDATLSVEEARSVLSSELQPDEGRLVLVAVDGEEVLAYEFLCQSGENEYLVYINAETGEEAEILTIRGGMRGRYLV